MSFFLAEMGRSRKYATEEEAHEAKKQQMRENYQKRKAAKQAETPKKETKPRAKSAQKKEVEIKPKLTNDEIIDRVVSIMKEALEQK